RSRSLLGHRRFQALALQEAFRSGFRIAAEGLSTSSTEIYGVPGGVPPASGTGRGRFTIHRFGSADLRRCGSRQSIEAGCCGRDVYLTLQTYLGGLYINQFNRFGRQWRVFLQAEGEERRTDRDIAGYFVRNNEGTMVPLSAVLTTRTISGPEYTNRFNLYRSAQVIGSAAPGYTSGQAMAALEDVAREVLPT